MMLACCWHAYPHVARMMLTRCSHVSTERVPVALAHASKPPLPPLPPTHGHPRPVRATHANESGGPLTVTTPLRAFRPCWSHRLRRHNNCGRSGPTGPIECANITISVVQGPLGPQIAQTYQLRAFRAHWAAGPTEFESNATIAVVQGPLGPQIAQTERLRAFRAHWAAGPTSGPTELISNRRIAF
jgi:hypothetical protein